MKFFPPLWQAVGRTSSVCGSDRPRRVMCGGGRAETLKGMTSVRVGVDNFVRAETDRMFGDLQRDSGGINRFSHNREPAPVDRQTVIRMNRDTLYSFAIVDISAGATMTVPDSGERYLSMMVVNQDHYINRIFHDPGDYELTVAAYDTPYVAIAARVLVDPADPGDLAAVSALQDQFGLKAGSARPFVAPDYDKASFDATRGAVLTLAKGMSRFDHAFGSKDEVDPIRHLLATAAGWGGLPDREASYVGVEPGLPVGEYTLTVRDVPVDAFWSVSVYNADGFFEPNDLGVYSVNSVTAQPEADGSVVIHFGGCGDGVRNCVPITDGWNYVVRLYRPRAEILNGTWTVPAID
ncbi:DUF1254 domain-containing protein [Kribbella sp. NPDC004875]|uniref:DUF1254 domain-containing protein n=1 Tax=Kribbella sp. NPDC004875 TaxID=3364107 RepID=UPI0036A80B81